MAPWYGVDAGSNPAEGSLKHIDMALKQTEAQDPREWFVKKYGIDLLQERMRVIEHSGNDVVRFIERYLEDNGIEVKKD